MAGVPVLNGSVSLYIFDDGGTALKADRVGNLVDISEIGGEVQEYDVTDLDSEGVESVPGFVDNGTITLTQNVTPENAGKLEAYFKGKEMKRFGVVYKDFTGYNIGFKGFIKSFKRGAISVGGTHTVTMDVRVSGAYGDFLEPSQE